MKSERLLEYVMKVRPLLDRRAIFSDETEQFLRPTQPYPGDEVRIRIRTAHSNVDSVHLIIGKQRIPMEIARTIKGFDYYEAHIKAGRKQTRYLFELRTGPHVFYYSRLGISRELQEQGAFSFVPGHYVPEWAMGAVMYQIYVDRFANGDPTNDVVDGEYSYLDQHVHRVTNWDEPITGLDVRNFYGGDLQGVIDKLDYLQELGVEVLYLNPIFVSPSNHKYDTQDYDHVDPHFGKVVEDVADTLAPGDQDNAHAGKYIERVTGLANLEASDEVLIRLVNELHRRGMRIILDGVFNHCGSFNKWMDREGIYAGHAGFQQGAYQSEESPYCEYFRFQSHEWPHNGNYEGWWGYETLPKLNYEASKALQNEIYRIAAKWVSPPFNVDGWRLDVAADLGHSKEFNHAFWRGFRRAVRRANKEALIVAEHYGDATDWLLGDQWDTIMNYDAFMEPLSWFLTGMEKHSDSFNADLFGNEAALVEPMRYNMLQFRKPALFAAMNQLDNHDHSRFLTRTNQRVGRVEHLGPAAAGEGVDKAVMREAVVIQMTWPGAPTLYYGDEAGVCGFTDPDNRRPYPWHHEDKAMLRFYKAAIAVHKTYPVLRTGSLRLLCEEMHVLAFARFDEKESVITAVNNRTEPVQLDVPVWIAGLSREGSETLRRVLRTDERGYRAEEKTVVITGGILPITLAPKSAEVFVCELGRPHRSGRKRYNYERYQYGKG